MGRLRDRRAGRRHERRNGEIVIYDDSPGFEGGENQSFNRLEPLIVGRARRTDVGEFRDHRDYFRGLRADYGRVGTRRVLAARDRFDLHERRRDVEKRLEAIGEERGGRDTESGGAAIAAFFGAEARTGFRPSATRLREIADEFNVGITYLENLAANLNFSPLTVLQEEADRASEESALKTTVALADQESEVSSNRRRRRLRTGGGGRESAPGPLSSGTSQQGLLATAQRRSILEDRR